MGPLDMFICRAHAFMFLLGNFYCIKKNKEKATNIIETTAAS